MRGRSGGDSLTGWPWEVLVPLAVGTAYLALLCGFVMEALKLGPLA
jgi:hypothetical protein